MSVERIKGLDALRGLMASSVMAYHYASWSSALWPSIPGNLLSKLGLYAVESFYVLSGFSLFHAYNHADFAAGDTAARFFWKRVMRLLPLFMFVVVVMLLRGAWHETSLVAALANMTLTFGFIDPALSVVTGGWSIGLEMVFYTLFAGVMWLRTRFAAAVPASALLSIAAAGVWAFVMLTSDASLASQWTRYVAVPNHLFFFLGGMWLCSAELAGRGAGPAAADHGGALSGFTFALTAWLLLVAFCAIVPITIDEIRFATGLPRLLFSLLCFAAVALCARVRLSNRPVSRLLVLIGEISYGVYLLHPLAWFALETLPLSQAQRVALAAVLTLAVATASYYGFELRFTRLPAPWTRSRSEGATARETTAG